MLKKHKRRTRLCGIAGRRNGLDVIQVVCLRHLIGLQGDARCSQSAVFYVQMRRLVVLGPYHAQRLPRSSATPKMHALLAGAYDSAHPMNRTHETMPVLC